MESTRRPSLDRSREPGSKKPRITADSAAAKEPNPNGRPFLHRPLSVEAAVPAVAGTSRYWASNERVTERAEAYQPQAQLYHELVNQYKRALAELVFNSKPIITNLTIIAGENLHVAKAIAATICSNVLEVPSERKLPSLYLLDSIVKNIGRDYIRYFAARLPEVFCTAYRQIDPSLHQSMRHLFGTWKGVFPPQTLQLIEKELGFGATLNNSDVRSSRPDSQAQRPQHSIHVNPKYLERQRLNNRVKDGSLSVSNPSIDIEKLDKVPDVGRQWVEKIQHSQRDVLNGHLSEKKANMYEESGYASEISRNSLLGIERTSGKVAESQLGRSWFAGGSRIKEVAQMNGITAKHGIVSHPASKNSNVEVLLQSAAGPVAKTSGRNSSWRNSDEEEFLWSLHPRIPEQDALKRSSSLRKDIWSADDPEKLDMDESADSRRVLNVLPRYDREDSSDSTENKDTFANPVLSSSWGILETQSGENVIDAKISVPGISYTEGYSTTSRPSAMNNSASSNIGVSGIRGKAAQSSAQSSARQQFLDPAHLQSRSFDKASRHPVQADNAKLQVQEGDDLQQSLFPGISRKDPPVSASIQSEHSESQATEDSRKSTTSSLLAAVMESGVLSKLNAVGSNSRCSEDNRQAQFEVSKAKMEPKSLATNRIIDESALKSDDLPKGQSTLPRASDPSPAPISDLLSSLVAKGLISTASQKHSPHGLASATSSKTGASAPVQKISRSAGISRTNASVNSASGTPVVSDSAIEDSSSNTAAKAAVDASPLTSAKSDNLIGLQFKSDVLRELHPNVITALFDDSPHRCSSCGIRLKIEEQLSRHLEWHVLKDSSKVSRKWYAEAGVWAAGSAALPIGVSTPADDNACKKDDDEPMVAADEDQCVCVLCGEMFEDFYDQNRDVWMFRGTIRMTSPKQEEHIHSPIVHARCLLSTSLQSSSTRHFKTENDAE